MKGLGDIARDSLARRADSIRKNVSKIACLQVTLYQTEGSVKYGMDA